MHRSLFFVLLSLFLPKLSPAAELVFRMPLVKFSSCEANLAKSEFRKSVESIIQLGGFLKLPGLKYADAGSVAESLFYAHNLTAMAVAKNFIHVSDYVMTQCKNYSDQTPANAILHFVLSAYAAANVGPDLAKQIMDLHESGAEYSYDQNGKILPLSAMDVFNNYQGIEAGAKYYNQSSAPKPLEFFLQLALDAEKAGKLRSTLPSYGYQFCAIKKDPALDSEISTILEEAKKDSRFTIQVLQNFPLTEEDIKNVIAIETEPDDILFRKLTAYKEALQCCE